MTVAVWLLARVPVVALKLAVVAAAATVTDAGTVSEVLLLDRVTTAPPAGAAWVKVTVQVDVEFEAKVLGEHRRPVMPLRTVTVPPLPAMVVPIPAGDAPRAPIMEIGTTEPPAAVPSVTVAVATVPLAIGVAFRPVATQVTDPLAAPQATVLPTAVSAGPDTILMEAMVPVG
ncbi:MAG: hypothetical protein ACLQU1_08115 [Bryobacteraceae bacterium]